MLLRQCLCLWFAFLVGSFHLCLTSGEWYSPLRRGGRIRTITVDQSGKGDFSSIQAAINSVPNNNQYWVYIKIKAGIYREQVEIPQDKPYIILKGQSRKRTKIVWDDYDAIEKATFKTKADNTVAISITFVNSYNFPKNNKPIVRAVAAMVAGDKCAFYKCGFQGMQDTLWDTRWGSRGRHYFKRCSIQGSVDFIFGNAQSLYEDCYIQAREAKGFITAQRRNSPEEEGGFVFKRCKVFGRGPTYLGRPWGAYARVIFYKSNLTNVVDPSGWDSWVYNGQEQHLTFQEVGNYGPGADTSRRVSWINKLNLGTVQELTSLSFVNQDDWVQKLPVRMK
ncbi:hypothetical protein Tsubulata_003027 [Turnera subulata]|uniref:Pectinesterase n=1 Tax=Turnera subulata TaxID=218843 RepID=A0A9Q0JGH5_9ROSI|nr:hypothetical protein Tsubulata_003027 [Turnera subulata]